jgi:hypothetical protein
LDATISPTASTFCSLGFGGDAASTATSYTPDPHAASKAEAQCCDAGLHSEPTLLYRTGQEQWSPARDPESQRHLKELTGPVLIYLFPLFTPFYLCVNPFEPIDTIPATSSPRG